VLGCGARRRACLNRHAMREEEESFKVTDRRGRARDGEVAESQAPIPAGSSSLAPPSGRSEGTAATTPGRERRTPSADLQQLFLMFASSALINLGEAPDPSSGERSMDLGQAREAIDVLLLLRDKTNGNRTEQESRLLEEILYDVQMRFVRACQPQPPR
jgi:hypothetical protein